MRRRWQRTPPPSKAAIEWQLEFGESAEYLEELAEDENREIPGPLLRRPELEAHQATLLRAFFLLCPDRPIGFGVVGAIPTLAILALADVIGEDPMVFLSLCRGLDEVYMERINAARKASQK